MNAKIVVIEADVTGVSTNGISAKGVDAGSGEEYKFRLVNHGNVEFRDLQVGAKIRLSVEVLP